MISTLALVIILVVIVAFVVPSVRGVPRLPNKLEPAMRHFLECDLDRAYLQLRMPYRSTPFLQFEKRKNHMGINSLVLAFPLAPWTGDAPKKIEQYAKDRNLPYSTRPVGASGLRFLFVDFDDMTSVAAKCAEHLLLDVFKIGQGTKVRVRIDPIADPEQD